MNVWEQSYRNVYTLVVPLGTSQRPRVNQTAPSELKTQDFLVF